MSHGIHTVTRGPVLEVTLDRPKANAIDLAASRRLNEIFSAFGLAFEDYALQQLMRIFPSSPTLASRLAPRVEGKTTTGVRFELDAILND